MRQTRTIHLAWAVRASDEIVGYEPRLDRLHANRAARAIRIAPTYREALRMGSFVGAMIATYFLSRLLLRIVPLAGPGRLVAAHLVSLAALALLIGLVKAYYTSFAIGETIVFIGPQLIWLVIDVVRGKAEWIAARR